MERTLIAQSNPTTGTSPSDCPIGNLDSDFKCRANNIVINGSSPTLVYPNFSVPSGGIIATLPNYMDASFYGKLQEGFVQSVVLALVYLGVTLVIKYLNSLKK
ncbi:hypothetical protein [Pseudanabaena yagii]|uniref:Uncharacterized protein n=1 Tax=Pseudanabaena yagii GIHE-NHR1 TaxID=2722753 RepID=A0ABX1LSW0_9CYAN|nr:hypothetical protein [Pseudanabaena yagii]NMF57884.1 hypothetical protein [Pseudanabaena yagii GIHE-NHR1]